MATQGPLPDTVDDFWRMIWENGSSTIVMLTKLRENGRVKCHRYWPQSGAETYGQYQVILLEVVEYPNYVLREFKIVDTKVRISQACFKGSVIGFPSHHRTSPHYQSSSSSSQSGQRSVSPTTGLA